ncbi:hypothetical protein HN903_02245 [archaeon]|jgi:hypothetical protein|nr:hypothetical protein [archaeon]MBT6956649.1 hypothetical protein [archaeon]MBT7128553.1 hypothetical protein [archaeon]
MKEIYHFENLADAVHGNETRHEGASIENPLFYSGKVKSGDVFYVSSELGSDMIDSSNASDYSNKVPNLGYKLMDFAKNKDEYIVDFEGVSGKGIFWAAALVAQMNIDKKDKRSMFVRGLNDGLLGMLDVDAVGLPFEGKVVQNG